MSKPRPLIVMTPKSLLRLPAATSTVEELAEGGFERVIDDPRFRPAATAAQVTKLVLCSGKVYYDIAGHEEREAAAHIAVARVELLYPFPEDELRELMESYPNLERVVWVQEEPRNMGARASCAGAWPASCPSGSTTTTSAASCAPRRARATRRPTSASRRGSSGWRSTSSSDKLEPDASARRPILQSPKGLAPTRRLERWSGGQSASATLSDRRAGRCRAPIAVGERPQRPRAEPHGERRHVELGLVLLDAAHHGVGHRLGRAGCPRPAGSFVPASANIPASEMKPG